MGVSLPPSCQLQWTAWQLLTLQLALTMVVIPASHQLCLDDARSRPGLVSTLCLTTVTPDGRDRGKSMLSCQGYRHTPSPRFCVWLFTNTCRYTPTALQHRPYVLQSTLHASKRSGWSPLHLAAAAGSTKAVKALLAAGVDPDAQSKVMHSACLHASQSHTLCLDLPAGCSGSVDATACGFLQWPRRRGPHAAGGRRQR